MSEPRLEDIGDYNTLKGEKKKIVWIVIGIGLLIGLVYSIAYRYYDSVDDSIQTNDIIKIVPNSKILPVK